jgi:hypothetical protein
VLCQRIDRLTSPKSGGSLGYNFIDHQTVGARILRGPKAMPELIRVLTEGNHSSGRRLSVRSATLEATWAERALTEQLEREDDTEVRQGIEEALKQRPRVSRHHQ